LTEVSTVKRIYISGPITFGDLAANIRQADDAMLALMRAGLAPLNPMLTCFAGSVWREGFEVHGEANAKGHEGFCDLTHGHWIASDLAWVEVADAVLRLPGESVGADAECAHARAIGVQVYYSVEAVIDAMLNHNRSA
jgi:hypothetical protein